MPDSHLRRILVVGAGGYYGRAVYDVLAARAVAIPTHRSRPALENSVRYTFPEDDLAALARDCRAHSIVFVAEIEKHQPREELNDPRMLDRHFTRTVRAVAHVRFVYVSSDGIFDGAKGHYRETDSPQPQTPYGRNLLVCEQAVRAACENCLIVRPSYLYGHCLGALDKRLARTRQLCLSGQPPVFFDDMYKSPIHVRHAAALLAQLTLSDHVGIVHVGGPRMSVFDFHRQAMQALGVPGELRSEKMPTDRGLLRDTSLDSGLSTALTSFVPRSIAESFRQFPAG